MIERISNQAQSIIESYQNIPFGKKTVLAPYFMNLKGQRGGLRVMVGKGTVDEIIQEVKVWAQVKGFDLRKAKPEQIREFMINMGIGIDCSGFVVYVLNEELKSRGMGSVWKYLNFSNKSLFTKIKRFLRPVENIGAQFLTSDENCIKIKNLNEIRPADLIRAKGKQKNAHHVAIITEVQRDETNTITQFTYAHSHRFYEHENGIRIGKVEITDLKKPLKDQKWIDDLNGRNYMLEDLLVEYEDNGIRRLKFLTE